jgi:ATP-dependent DNA helicase RecG
VDILARLADGRLDVLIGTHALLEPAVRPARLTLAVIDEQQRFGVDQRNRLLAKGGAPDALSLSATPIPRTLAIATLGNYTLSFIRHPAKSHAPRTTRVLRKTDRGEAYGQALAELEAGHRVYVVCPLIGTKGAGRDADDADMAEGRDAGTGHVGGSGATKKSKAERFESESEGADPDFVDIDDFEAWRGDNPSAAATEAEFLRRRIFCPYEVALLHGAMPATEKARVMQDFAEGRVQVLVSTTVIEVGVDVPEATVMIIEDADRFGLSQLHQLRGRIGRGGDKSYAYLVSSTKREDALARLEFMTHCDDGFELAEFDLSLRREGDILGVRQSGASSLKLVKLAQDGEIIEAAHADAAEMLAHDATLTATTHAAIAREIKITIEDRPDGGSKGGMRK